MKTTTLGGETGHEVWISEGSLCTVVIMCSVEWLTRNTRAVNYLQLVSPIQEGWFNVRLQQCVTGSTDLRLPVVVHGAYFASDGHDRRLGLLQVAIWEQTWTHSHNVP